MVEQPASAEHDQDRAVRNRVRPTSPSSVNTIPFRIDPLAFQPGNGLSGISSRAVASEGARLAELTVST